MGSVEIDIYGMKYTIKGDADPEYVKQLARFVDDRMRSAARHSQSAVGAQRIAVLAALNIADELHKLKRRHQEVENMVREKTGDLFDILQDES